MKLFFLMLLCAFYSIYAIDGLAQGVTKNGQSTSISSSFVNSNGKIGSSIALNKNGQKSLTIGMPYLGGILAYILQPGDPGYIDGKIQGLIATTNDQSTGAPFGTAQSPTNAWDTNIGAGYSNTTTIVTNNGTAGIAARLCNDLVSGGYSDWFLPSKDELNKLYLNRTAIGGFQAGNYWSSSEFDNDHYDTNIEDWVSDWEVYYQSFIDGSQDFQTADKSYKVRAVRSFGLPYVTTTAITALAAITASSGGNVISDCSFAVTSRGVCWSTSPNPTTANSKTTDGSGTGVFTSALSGLTTGIQYYVRAYATNDIGTAYGNEVSFTIGLVPMTTTAITPTNTTTATGGGNITGDGGLPITARGVCWNTSTGPTIANSKTTDGSGTGAFTSSLTGLIFNTTYYVRAYATNSAGTSYGDEKSFIIGPIQITTSNTLPTSLTTATSNVVISQDGGLPITARGVCWNTSTGPTIANYKTSNGAGTGSFSSSITGLTGGVIYYVRSYATNIAGTTYGNENTVGPGVINLTTTALTNQTATSATSGGTVIYDGAVPVTARGVCWSASKNPTTANSKTSDGSGTGSYSSSITGLTPGTPYYVRAYATNGAGTFYGNEICTVDLPVGKSYQGGIIAYILKPGDINYVAGVTQGIIAATSDQSAGTPWGCDDGKSLAAAENYGIGYGSLNTDAIVSNCGTAGIAAKICRSYTGGGYGDWFLPSAYELQQLYTNRVAIGGFQSSIYWSSTEDDAYNEEANTHTYYGYAINFTDGNAVDALKGSSNRVRAIRTFGLAPITTAVTKAISLTSATSGGNIISDGSTAVTARGICWSTNPLPTTSDSKTIDGSGTGVFSSTMTGLTNGTTYYVRAYATNTTGTSYGDQTSFTVGTITLSTTPISMTSFTTITTGGNITIDGGSAITARGVCWSTSPLPTIANSKTTDGSGIGTYTSSLTGLTASTTYYLRSYATNGVGTFYGDQVTFKQGIGMSYQGGTVAYILQSGDPGYVAGQTHGLIVGRRGSDSYRWTSTATLIGTSTAIGTGSTNTDKIATTLGSGSYLVRVCYDLVQDGYSDWYLASKDELNKIFLNNSILKLEPINYWTSSEYDATNAYKQNFQDGASSYMDKSILYGGFLLPVRSF